jgi:hypothetical protein
MLAVIIGDRPRFPAKIAHSFTSPPAQEHRIRVAP